MKKGTELDESVIRDIGHAFGYYDYGGEHGLAGAFPSQEAAAIYICGYVRMVLNTGMLYAIGEHQEVFLVYQLPKQKIRPAAVFPLTKGLLGSMSLKELSWYLAQSKA